MENTLTRDELIDEVRDSLPSNEILNQVSNLAVQNPYNEETYFLKLRDTSIPLEQYELYSNKNHPLHHYEELRKKSILLHPSLLHPRGRSAFEALAKLNTQKD